MKTYRTYGSVRGGCGHRHRTLSGAARCLEADQNDCKRARGYSDRQILASEDGGDTWERLDDDEQVEANRLRGLCG